MANTEQENAVQRFEIEIREDERRRIEEEEQDDEEAFKRFLDEHQEDAAWLLAWHPVIERVEAIRTGRVSARSAG